jgi:WD40 repeat protein
MEPTQSLAHYSDPALGFAVEYPGTWEVIGPAAQVDPSLRTYHTVEFVSDLYAYGEQASGRYGVRVAVGESAGETLTETVAYSLAPIVPPLRDQIETRCCLAVGGEPAMELLGLPPAGWASRRVVVLHGGHEYNLTFYPQFGLDGGTSSDVTAQAAFKTFLRTFTFIPVTVSVPPAVPVVTPAPTPGPAADPSLGEPILLGRGQITDAAFTPDAAAVAIGWANGVSLVTVADTAERWWQPTEAPVVALDVHPDGHSVAAALSDGSILIMDAANGSPARYDGARPHAYWGDVAWSPDGRTIAFQFIGPRRGDPIYLLDVADGSLGEVPGSRIDPHTWPFLTWSPDSQTITLAALGEECPHILDVRTGETVLVLRVEGVCAAPHDIAWSPGGDRIAAAGALIDPHGGETIARLEDRENWFVLGQPGWPNRFSLDGAYLAAGGQVGSNYDLSPLVVWDAVTGKRVAQFGEEGDTWDLGRNKARMALAVHGQSLLVLTEDGELARWSFGGESRERNVLGRVPVVVAQPPLSWSADGRRFAAGNRYGGAVVWEVAAGRLLASFSEPLAAPALSPSGDLLALIDREREELVLWNLAGGDAALRLPSARSLPRGVAFSPDCAQIAYGSDSRILVADVVSGEQIAVLGGHPEEQLISRIVWSPDGNALVSASGVPGDSGALATLVLWQHNDEAAWTEVLRTETTRAGYDCCVSLALFSPAGGLVALEAFPSVEAKDLQVVVYDLETGKVVLRLSEYELAAWISDEMLLTSEAQYDSRLTRWHVRTGESTVGGGRGMGDNVYAPSGLVYARPNDRDPYYGRGIQVHSWETEEALDRDIYDGDVFEILWSPNGRLVAALASNGVVVVWPFGQ